MLALREIEIFSQELSKHLKYNRTKSQEKLNEYQRWIRTVVSSLSWEFSVWDWTRTENWNKIWPKEGSFSVFLTDYSRNKFIYFGNEQITILFIAVIISDPFDFFVAFNNCQNDIWRSTVLKIPIYTKSSCLLLLREKRLQPNWPVAKLSAG